MPIDREATLKNAEKLLRVGRLDAAIGEYSKVVEEHPRDWATANTLGDLYLRAAQPDRAVVLYERVADLLMVEGFLPKAAALLKKILKIAPDNDTAQVHLAEIAARQGLLAEARAHFGAVSARRRQRGDVAGADELIIHIGRLDGADLQSRAAAAEALDRTGDLAAAAAMYGAVCDELRDKGSPAEAVHALLRLVEVCVDGGLESTMYEAQAQLADAYLATGRPEEARIIAEDLVTREPWDSTHVERLRRSLQMLGVVDVEAALAERLQVDSLAAAEPLDDTGDAPLDDVATTALDVVTTAEDREAALEALLEIDLTTVLGELQEPPRVAGTPASARDLEQVFAGMRAEVARQRGDDEAGEHLELGRTYVDMGMLDEAMEPLEVAARAPELRFEAIALLARVHRDRGDLPKAIEWYERAAEVPATSPDAGRTLLYDLGDVLETIGENARALAVFLEIQADAPGFGDVSDRVKRLSRAEAGG